jgi:hypothetical protein
MPSLIFTIPSEKYETFKKYFLIAYPNQTLDENDPVPMTDDQWIKHKIFLFIKNGYKHGKRQEYEEQNEPTYDDGIVTKGV